MSARDGEVAVAGLAPAGLVELRDGPGGGLRDCRFGSCCACACCCLYDRPTLDVHSLPRAELGRESLRALRAESSSSASSW